jgi:putative oxidoreductase
MKDTSLPKRFFTNPYLALILRLYIGGLFIYAGISKIDNIGAFTVAIATYGIVSYSIAEIMAIVVPWVELISGIFLVAGIGAPFSAAIIAVLLALFSIAILIDLIKGVPLHCGCFRGEPARVGDVISWWEFARDILWFIMTLHVFFFDKSFHLESRSSLLLKLIKGKTGQ